MKMSVTEDINGMKYIRVDARVDCGCSDEEIAKSFTDDVEAIKDQEPTTKIEESNFSQEQYLADIQSAYDCGKSVIDKIRAEMYEEMLSHSGTGEEVIQAYTDGLKKGLEIIDKYKTESEE